MQECDFENLYFVFYVEKIVAGQVSLILSSKGLNHNLKISPPAPGIFLLDSTTWFLYLKKNPDGSLAMPYRDSGLSLLSTNARQL